MMPELFERETILRMIGHFQNLLRGVIDNPSMRLAELAFLTITESNQITEWNVTQTEYSRELSNSSVV